MLSRLCCIEAVPLAPSRVYAAGTAHGVRSLRAGVGDEAWPGAMRALEITHASAGAPLDWPFPEDSAHLLVAAGDVAGQARFRLDPSDYAVAPGGAALARSVRPSVLRWQGAQHDASCVLHLAYRPHSPAAAGWVSSVAPATRENVGPLRLSLLFGSLAAGELRGTPSDDTAVVEVAQPLGYAAALPVPPGGVALLWVRSGLLRFGSPGADRTLATGALGQVNGGPRKGYIYVEPIRGPATWTYVATALPRA